MIANSPPIDDVTTDEACVRRLLDDRVDALRAKDVDRVMSLNSPDIVVFDIPTPLQYLGNYACRTSIVAWLNSYRGPLSFETRDLRVAVGGDVAFTHSLFRVSGTMKNGTATDHWVRLTFCLRKIGGKWRITHQHVSLPIDLESGEAVHYRQP
ncbi:MAG: nuclear transport factor 2 family protein [Kutzneria sp.]|nr:nuclear transport factor 2 family protein [Kutzneria sp.]